MCKNCSKKFGPCAQLQDRQIGITPVSYTGYFNGLNTRITRMTAFIKTKLKKSDDKTNIEKYIPKFMK